MISSAPDVERNTRWIVQGGAAWAGLAAYVAITDTLLIRRRRRSLSEAFGRALEAPRQRPFLVGIWLVLTVHLFSAVLPPQVRRVCHRVDPFGCLARLIAPA